MKIRLSRNILEIRRQARVKEMGKIAPLITGSLGQIQRRCGNPNCRCAKGEKHPAWILTWKEKKKTTGLYVPVDQIKEVQKWIQEYRRVQKLIQEISNLSRQMIRKYVDEKRAENKAKKNLRKILETS